MTRVVGDVLDTARTNALLPKSADVKRRFKSTLREKPDGSYTIQLDTVAKRLEFAEMMEPYTAAATAKGKRLTSQVPTVPVIGPRGERREVAAFREGSLSANGCRPVVRYGGVKVERWSDGLLYRESPDGWEPLGRCSLTTPYHDCGNRACSCCHGDGQ